MSDEILLKQNEDGTYSKYEPYATLDIETEEDFNRLQELLEFSNRMQWIPCSERLPKCNGCYLVWRPHFFGGEIGMPAICYFDGQDTWHDSYGVDFTRILNAKDVIAWMPLPKPYKAGSAK